MLVLWGLCVFLWFGCEMRRGEGQNALSWQWKFEELEQQSINKENVEKAIAARLFGIPAEHVEHDELSPVGVWQPGLSQQLADVTQDAHLSVQVYFHSP